MAEKLTTRLTGHAWRKLSAQVFDQKGTKCYYCGQLATQIDHVIPLAKGGGNELENLVPSCSQCNRAKSDQLITRKYFINPRFKQVLEP